MDLRIALAAVAETTREGATIGDVEARLGRRSHAVLAALACLPFLTPIPTPGLSIPFGLLISGIGLWQAFGVERPGLALASSALAPPVIWLLVRPLALRVARAGPPTPSRRESVP